MRIENYVSNFLEFCKGELRFLCNLLGVDKSVRYGPARRCVHTNQ